MKKNLFFLGIILAFIFIGCNKPQITCDIIKPLPGTTFELGEIIELALNVDVENTTIDVVHVYLDDVGYTKKSFFPFNFTINTENMEKGAHTIRVVAFASNGAKIDKTVSFTLAKFESPDFVSFSDGKFPKGWTSEGWMITSPGFDNDFSIRRVQYNNLVSAIKTCDENIKFIEFYAKEEEPYWYPSELEFYINGQRIEKIEMTESWKKYSFPVPSGEHTFSWRVPNGSDGYVYLDNIKFYKEEE
jgi:hypothetical protein